MEELECCQGGGTEQRVLVRERVGLMGLLAHIDWMMMMKFEAVHIVTVVSEKAVTRWPMALISLTCVSPAVENIVQHCILVQVESVCNLSKSIRSTITCKGEWPE